MLTVICVFFASCLPKLGEENTDEENGIEIVIPVKENDCDTFKDTAEEIFQHFKVRPIIHGGHQLNFDDRDTLFEGKDWKWRKNKEGYNGYYNHHKGDGIAVMGNIGYPMDFDSLNYSGEDYAELQSLCSSNLILQINIGDLEISASREKLQYTEYTRKNLIKRLKQAQNELAEQIGERFKGCKTLFEARYLIFDTFTFASANSNGVLFAFITPSTASIKLLCDVVLKLFPTIPIGLSVKVLITYFLLANFNPLVSKTGLWPNFLILNIISKS